MADNNAATPPAQGVVIDYEKLAQAIGTALAPSIGTAISEANKPLSEALGKLQPAAPAQTATAGGKADEPKFLTAEDLTRVLDQRDQQRQQSEQTRAQRQAFVAERLKNVPAAYQGQLGNDPTKWEAEARQISDAYKADLGRVGAKLPDVGGDQATGASTTTAAARPDLSKLSSTELIKIGLNQPTNGQGAAAAGTTSAATAATTAAAAK